MRLKKFFSVLVVVAMLSISSNTFAASVPDSSYNGVAYNKLDLSAIGTLEDINVSQSEKKIDCQLHFKREDIQYQCCQYWR